jgi:hypothetical protein
MNLFNRDPRLLDTLYALGIQGGDPAGGERTLPSPVMEPFIGGGVPKQPLGRGVSIVPLNPYGGGTPTQQLDGSGGGLRTPPITLQGAGGISSQGLQGLPAQNPPQYAPPMRLGDFRNWLQSYRQRRFGNPTTAPVGQPPNPANIRLGQGVY